jgi:ATP-binding cassette subfamily B protein
VDVSLSLVMLLRTRASCSSTLDWRLGLVMTLPVPVFCWLIYRHGESLNGLFIPDVAEVVAGDGHPVGHDSWYRVVKAFNQESVRSTGSRLRTTT